MNRQTPAPRAGQQTLDGISICRICGAASYQDDKFCACCGEALIARPRNQCSRCRAEILQPVANFCPQCGAAISQRRSSAPTAGDHGECEQRSGTRSGIEHQQKIR